MILKEFNEINLENTARRVFSRVYEQRKFRMGYRYSI